MKHHSKQMIGEDKENTPHIIIVHLWEMIEGPRLLQFSLWPNKQAEIFTSELSTS